MSQNGGILTEIIERHALVVANGLKQKRSGIITRRRSTVVRTEESAIDFVILSSDMAEDLVTIIIDENRNHVLKSLSKTKNGTKVNESDHNSIVTKFILEWKDKIKSPKTEIFNFNDKDGQKKFQEMTSNNTKLSDIFSSKEDINTQTKKFLKKLNGVIHQCFKKVKVKPAHNKEINSLFKRQKELQSKKDKISQLQLKEVQNELADKMADDMYKIVKEEVDKVDCEAGGFNSGHLWKLKSKLRPKFTDYPTALTDIDGNLVTSKEDIRNVTVNHFKKVLENRKIKSELEKYQCDREELCALRVSEASKNITPKWEIEDVQFVIKHLKKKKSRDACGYSNELFQMGGSDLTEAVLRCMNNIKDQQKFPERLQNCNITSLYKNKGSRKNLNNYR